MQEAPSGGPDEIWRPEKGSALRPAVRESASRRDSCQRGGRHGKGVDATDARTPTFTATVLERKDGSVTLQRESGTVEILSMDDPGISLRIGKGVEKGSRVKVTEERTGSSRTFTIEILPGA